MTDLQKHLLEIMKYFHTLCVENDLTYYAIAGTALGAMRHEGFIPWDEDLDVVMPRDDYNRLLKLANTKNNMHTSDVSHISGEASIQNSEASIQNSELDIQNKKNDKIRSERFIIKFPEFSPKQTKQPEPHVSHESIDNSKDFPWEWCRIIDASTTIVLKKRNTLITTGLFIDIFPLDGAGNTKPKAFFTLKKLKKINTLHYLVHTSWVKGKKLYKNIACWFFRTFLPLFISVQSLRIKYITECKKLDYNKSSFCIYDAGNDCIFEKSWFGTPKLHKFEDMEIFLPEHADIILATEYGDWETLPPKSEQVSHHGFLHVDLDMPYLDYKH